MNVRLLLFCCIFVSIILLNEAQQNEEDGCNFFASWNGTDSEDCGLTRSQPCLTLQNYLNSPKREENITMCIDGNGVSNVSQSVSMGKTMHYPIPVNLRGIGDQIPVITCPSDNSIKFKSNVTFVNLNFYKCKINGAVDALKIDRCSFSTSDGSSPLLDLSIGILFNLTRSQFKVNLAWTYSQLKLNFLITSEAYIDSNNFGNRTSMSVTAPVFQKAWIHNNRDISTLKWSFVFFQGDIHNFTMRSNSMERLEIEDRQYPRTVPLYIEDNDIRDICVINDASPMAIVGNKFGTSKFSLGTFNRLTVVRNTFFKFCNSYHNSHHNYYEGNMFYGGWMIQSEFSIDQTNVVMIEVRDCKFLNKGIIIPTLSIGSKISIYDCTFVGDTHPSKDNQVLPLIKFNFISGTVSIYNSSFSDNYASESGAGISAVTTHHPLSPLINVTNCKFHNLVSPTTGGAIFSRINLVVFNSSFWNNTSPLQGDSVWSSRTVSVKNVEFSLGSERGEVFSIPIKETNVSMNCPRWSIIRADQVADELYSVKCTMCSKKEYSTGTGDMIEGKINNPECVALPQGIKTVDNELLVQENTWCLPNRTLIQCYKCPKEYCPAVAHHFDEKSACKNNRTGILCGGCSEGKTASLLGARCVDSNKCSLFWISPYILKSIVFFAIYWIIPIGGTNSEWHSIMYVVQTIPLLTPTNQISILSLPFAPTCTPTVSNFSPCIAGGMTQRHIIIIQLFSSLFAPLLGFVGFLVVKLCRRWKDRSRSKKNIANIVEFQDERTSLLSSEVEEDRSVTFRRRTVRAKLTDPSEWIRVTLQSMLLVYSTLLANSFQLFWCVRIDGEQRLFIDATQSCDTTANRIAFIFFMVVLAPFPLMLLGLWAWMRKKERERKKSMGENFKFHEQSLLFLQSMYRNGFGWWESYSYARRTVQIFIFVLTSGLLRSCLLLFSSVVFLILQGCFYPMATRNGNRLEIICLACLTLVAAQELEGTPETRMLQVVVTLAAVVTCLASWIMKKLPIRGMEFLFL